MKMREDGMSRGYSRPRTFSGKKTIKNCNLPGNLDNVLLIDIDSDDNVIIIDVPESLEQKLRGASVPRECKRFPCIISIDDDGIDNVSRHESNEERDVNLDSDGTSSKRSHTSDRMEKFVETDAGDCQVIWEKKSAFVLSKCKKTCSKGAPSRNSYGLYTESESDSSEASTSDCEVMEGSFGELREQWEKASQKRKSNVCKGQFGVEDRVNPCSSHRDLHSDVEVECRNKQKCEDSVCSSSENVKFEKVNSSVSPATRDSFVSGGSFNHRMENPFSNSDLKGGEVSFSWRWKPRSHENNCSKDRDQNTVGEHSFPNVQARPNLRSDHRKASVQGDDASLCEGQHSGETHNINCKKVDKDSDENMAHLSSCYNTDSYEAQYGTSGSEGKENIISREKFVLNGLSSDDNMVEGVVGSSENIVRPVHEESSVSKNHSLAAPGVSQEKAGHHDTEKTDCGEKSFCKTQFREALIKSGKLSLAGGKEPLTDLASNGQHYNERNLLHSPLGDIMPTVQRDIINVREKLKETDEYKRAIEEEWAARQQQLEIQAEEARRLRKKRKAEILRVLDVEKRQRQRVEEMRETQKKDEENLSVKENIRVEVRKELYRLEITCIDMASLLRALGIHVEGGFRPLSHEVHAAYKRALLKFHPDRASRTNVHQQVEAEEKFKLISRMKERFLSTSCC